MTPTPKHLADLITKQSLCGTVEATEIVEIILNAVNAAEQPASPISETAPNVQLGEPELQDLAQTAKPATPELDGAEWTILGDSESEGPSWICEGDQQLHPVTTWDEARNTVEAHNRSLFIVTKAAKAAGVVEGMERACKLVCPKCADGLPLQSNGRHGVDGRAGPGLYCKASAIRAQMGVDNG